MKRAIAYAAGSLLLVWLVPARAAPSELSWEGPGNCMEVDRLRFDLERALGAPLEQSGGLEFQVRVETSASRSRARLRVSSAGVQDVNERILTAPNCLVLVDKLAVAISLALGSSTTSPLIAAPSEATAAVSDAQPSSLARDEPPSELARQPRVGPRPSAMALLVGDLGSLPVPALGATLGVQLDWQRFQLRALATLFFEQTASPPDGAGAAGGDIGLYFGALMACYELLRIEAPSLMLPLCLGADVGRLWGTGRNVLEPRPRASLWLAPHLETGLSWRIPDTQLHLQAQLGFAAPLNRDRFILDDIGTVHQPSSVVGRVGLGVALSFE